ncbi:unnamed protein product [Rhizoctonia solani]|uniref:Fungal specific transcription factor domain n=1 Tax=Rhizoctonia solani TaxID=456999 RepID=A0A8H3H646_9AGAM|nr:Fungal specific transcription factor domain [Rhizoctonia solani]QRW16951.1 Fungal specific transcription factor domain [Rhizoctonia solani]CAE6487650.1 unnamed protein product [Rhizoctonia solani]
MSSPKTSTPLALPAPEEGSANESGTTTLEIGGKSISFDKLGPMVVNSDGTLSRIANWQEMTPAEQNNTIRVLSKRNQLRTSTFAQAIGSTPIVDVATQHNAN